jgi:hypothetical protein
MRKNTKRVAIVSSAAVAVVGVAAGAWAFGWGVNGGGSGSATASDIKTLTAASTMSKPIYPGAKLTATVKVKNPNEFGVALDPEITATSVNLAGAVSKTESASNPCVAQVNEMLLPKVSNKVIVAAFPAQAPVVAGNNEETEVPANVTIGDLPQTCVGVKLVVNYTFTGKNVADAPAAA